MGFIRNSKGSLISEYFRLLKNAEGLQAGNMVDVVLHGTAMYVKSFIPKKVAVIRYDHVQAIEYGLRELRAGRKTVLRKVLVIDYLNLAGEECQIVFEDTRHFKGKKLVKKLRELCNEAAQNSRANDYDDDDLDDLDEEFEEDFEDEFK